jgi:hypothetical protein
LIVPEISEKPIWKEWTCRILISLDLYLVAQGYGSFLLARQQLVSPLIPQRLLYDVSAIGIEGSLVTTIGLAIGLWFYFYKKKIAAIIIFSIAAISGEMLFLLPST